MSRRLWHYESENDKEEIEKGLLILVCAHSSLWIMYAVNVSCVENIDIDNYNNIDVIVLSLI